MKQQTFEVAGKIDRSGKLKLYMDELNEFLKLNKEQNVIVTFQVTTPKTSESLRSYYYKVVVPSFQRAIWEGGERLTYQQTVERLSLISPVDRIRKEGADNLTNTEMIEHIESLKQIAAENFNIYIQDPNEL